MWLVQFVEIYKKYDYQNYGNFYYLNNKNSSACFQENKCNFTDRLSKCFQNKHARAKKLGFFEETNFYFHFKLFQYIAEIQIQPIFCSISILTNFLVIIVIRNKTQEFKKHLVNIMYSHIQVNAFFNIIYAIIKLASLINICIYPRSSFYSNIYKLPSSQYFKIYIVYFLGNSVRLCANCSYVCFSVSRYYLSTSKPSRVFKYFHKLNLKCFYSIFWVLSLGFSSFKLFQFRINSYSPGLEVDYPFDIYDKSLCDRAILIHSTNPLKCKLFTALNMLNTIFNNILFLLISILVDVSLIRFTNQNLKRKRALVAAGEIPDLKQAKQLKEKVKKILISF